MAPDASDTPSRSLGIVGAASAVGAAVRDLIARIVKTLGQLTSVALAVGCTGPSVEPSKEAKVEAAAVAMIDQQKDTPSPDEPKAIGNFSITFYYVIGEDEVMPKVAARHAAANDNATDLAATAEQAEPDDQKQVTLYSADGCSTIADVSQEFATQLAIQGTGKLKDGRVLNIWGRCKCDRTPCFKVTDNQWGTAGTGRPLQPFRTVAVDPKVVKLGTLLYVPLLEGRTMPGRAPWGGYVHDGCVVADDTGGHIDGNRLDLFVGRKGYFLGLSGSQGSHAWARHVPVFDGSKICERKGRHVARRAGAI